MAIDYDYLMSLRATGERVAYTDQAAMLYALGIGAAGEGGNPAAELPFAYEGAGLRLVPTFATALARSRLLDDCGWDFGQVLHVSEALELHRPLLESDELLIDSRVAGVADKGVGHGALVLLEMRARRARDERAVFTVQRTVLARGDGGFGGPRGGLPAPHKLPERPPDMACTLPTRPDQALLYRLSGDRNPLHADPVVARGAGFDRPILHGLATFGVACRAVLATICEYDPMLITAFAARFTAPVWPGEALLTEMWQDANVVSFRVRAGAAGRVVLDHGRCVLAD